MGKEIVDVLYQTVVNGLAYRTAASIQASLQRKEGDPAKILYNLLKQGKVIPKNSPFNAETSSKLEILSAQSLLKWFIGKYKDESFIKELLEKKKEKETIYTLNYQVKNWDRLNNPNHVKILSEGLGVSEHLAKTFITLIIEDYRREKQKEPGETFVVKVFKDSNNGDGSE